MDYQIIQLDNLKLYHSPKFEGGGIFAKDTFIELLTNGKTYKTIFEWCAGVGSIGFSLLDRGLCESLVLADISSDALALAEKTIFENNLQDHVKTYLIDKINDLPSTEVFDAVVANPPHFSKFSQVAPTVTKLNILNLPRFTLEAADGFRMGVDEDWLIHEEFYSNIARFCKNGCDIFLWENSHGSNISDFAKMIEEGGLEIIANIPDKVSKFSQCYTIHSKLNIL